MTCVKETWLGAYVLDALEPDQAEDVRDHITGCPICQDEVVRLSWIPALLRTLELEDIARLEDEATSDEQLHSPVLQRLLTATRPSRNKRWRRPLALLGGVVAAATIAGALAVGTGVLTRTVDARPVAIHTVDPHTQVVAALTLTRRTGGTDLHLTLRGVAPGEHCSLIARSRDGHRDVAASWVATYSGTADVPGSTGIPITQLSEVDVVTSEGRQLARLAVPDQNR